MAIVEEKKILISKKNFDEILMKEKNKQSA